MAFRFDVSEEVEQVMAGLKRRDPRCYETVKKKMLEIASRDPTTIDFYKNLRHGLSDYKRVHVCGRLVLMFKVLKKENHIHFERLKHHDEAYGP